MQRSNTYIVIFTAAMTIIVGGLLSLASQVLGPAQRRSIELDTKSQILSAVMDLNKKDDVLEIYNKRIQGIVVDANGDPVSTDEKGKPIIADKVDILKNFKKDPKDRMYPVFKFMDEENPEQVDAYILPMYGNGLWDKIWGFVAIDKDLQTIAGASFDHKQETPGLGARIATREFQLRFVGKTIYDENGNLVSVTVMKGEHGGGQNSIDYYKDQLHEVDGMSGATMTGKGVNSMIKNYLGDYQPFFNKLKSQQPL